VLSFFFFLCCILFFFFFFFYSSRRRHTRCLSDWSSDVCSSDLPFARANARTRQEVVGVGSFGRGDLAPGTPLRRDRAIVLRTRISGRSSETRRRGRAERGRRPGRSEERRIGKERGVPIRSELCK